MIDGSWIRAKVDAVLVPVVELFLEGRATFATDLAAFETTVASEFAAALPAGAGDLFGATATAGQASLVTIGTGLTLSGGVLFANGGGYTLPTATTTTLGAVIIDGTTLSVTSGTVRVNYGTAANTAAQGNDSRIIGALQASTAATLYAPLASPTLTGVPLAPTATAGTNTTQIATTAYVTTSVAAESARAIAAENTKASLVSPTFTGVPLAPTASASTNNTQIATTAFVTTAIVTEAVARNSAITTALTTAIPAETGLLLGGSGTAGLVSGITVGAGLSLTAGVLTASVVSSYTLSAATSSVLGGVKPDGTTITNTSGAISVTYGTTANTAAQGNDSRITGALSATTASTTYAPLVSPGLSGTPTAPTATAGTNTTQLATTSFVTTAVAAEASRATAAEALKAPLVSPVFTGTPLAPTATAGTNTTQVATTAYVVTAVATEAARAIATEGTKAPLFSPTFTGTPYATTVSTSDNSTALATTAYVQNNLASYQGALGFTPVRQGGGANQGSNVIRLGWDALGSGLLRLNVDGTDEHLLASNDTLIIVNNVIDAFMGEFAYNPNVGGWGYQHIGNDAGTAGTIIQWGWLSSTNGTYNFPIVFPNGCLSIAVTPSAMGTYVDAAVINGLSASQFNVATKQSTTADTLTGFPCYWIAVGY